MKNYLIGEAMGGVIKTSVSIPTSIYNEMLSLMAELSIDNKSKFVSDAISNHISQLKWRTFRGKVVGVLMIAYHHERTAVLKKLIDIQHNFIDIIRSSIHFHLTKELCFEVIGVVGEIDRVKKLVSEVSKVKKIYKSHVAFISLSEL